MADVVVTDSKWQFNFEFERDGEANSRTISVDNILNSAAGLSAAKAFRDTFIGSVSSPFSIIEPTTFIQPTGWRDEDPDEDPWTATACHLVRIDSSETHYEGGSGGGGGGDNPRNIRFVEGIVYYDGLTTTEAPMVSYFINSTWYVCEQVEYSAANGGYSVDDIPSDIDAVSIVAPGTGGYAPAEYTIQY